MIAYIFLLFSRRMLWCPINVHVHYLLIYWPPMSVIGDQLYKLRMLCMYPIYIFNQIVVM